MFYVTLLIDTNSLFFFYMDHLSDTILLRYKGSKIVIFSQSNSCFATILCYDITERESLFLLIFLLCSLTFVFSCLLVCPTYVASHSRQSILYTTSHLDILSFPIPIVNLFNLLMWYDKCNLTIDHFRSN